jgi:hypothetical protein
MCPACVASVALLVTGIVSTGGVTAAAIKLFRDKKTAARISDGRDPQFGKDEDFSVRITNRELLGSQGLYLQIPK